MLPLQLTLSELSFFAIYVGPKQSVCQDQYWCLVLKVLVSPDWLYGLAVVRAECRPTS